MLFELDLDGIYSDWFRFADDEDLMLGIIGQEVSQFANSSDLQRIRHFSVLVRCNNKRVLSRDLIRFGKIL